MEIIKQKCYFSNTISTLRCDFSEDRVEYWSGTRKIAPPREFFLYAAEV